MLVGLRDFTNEIPDGAATLQLLHPVVAPRVGRALEHVPVELVDDRSRVRRAGLLRGGERGCGKYQRKNEDRCAAHKGLPPAGDVYQLPYRVAVELGAFCCPAMRGTGRCPSVYVPGSTPEGYDSFLDRGTKE